MIQSAVHGQQAAVNLFKAAANATPADKNVVLSPQSLLTLGAMVRDGAGGTTQSELETGLLGWTSANDRSAMVANHQRYQNGLPGMTFNMANGLWVGNQAPISAKLVTQLQSDYGVQVTPANFASDPEAARQDINQWVEKITNSMIRELLKEGTIDQDTLMVLANAIYLKWDWAEQFDPQQTGLEAFHLLNGQADVPMMHQQGVKRPYFYDQTSKVEVVEFAIKGNAASVLILLPSNASRIPTLAAELSPERLNNWIKNMFPRQIDVSLPKLTAKEHYDMKAILASLGVQEMFDQTRADFSNINPNFTNGRLHVSNFVHQAGLSWNETGGEASAASAAIHTLECTFTPIHFNVNRPFLFAVREQSGDISFMGRVMDPRG